MHFMKYTFCLSVSVILLSCGGTNEAKKEVADAKPEAVVTVQTGAGVKASSVLMLTSYLQLKDALVNYDTASANMAAIRLGAAADSVDFSGTPDTNVVKTVRDQMGTIRSEALALVKETDLTEKRRSFSMITENLYPMLRAIQYNDARLYYQMCPMAFNDNETAYWISDSREIKNPYLGTQHPKYASGMLHCGELKDSLNYAR
jgi:Cu(I)/Ag(I) efflux system membrane fusion protein